MAIFVHIIQQLLSHLPKSRIMQSYNMMYPLVAFCLLALGHCQLTAQAAASITAPGCSQPIQTSSTSTIPATATVNMAIGQFPLFTPAVAPYLSAGVNSWTRSTTLINGTQTASGTGMLSLWPILRSERRAKTTLQLNSHS